MEIICSILSTVLSFSEQWNMNKTPLMERSLPTPKGDELEASLLQLVHHHHLSSLTLRRQTEKVKKEAIGAGFRVSELVVDAVNGGVQHSFINQKRIEAEIRSMSVTVSRFQKQTDQWLAASRALNTAIKEIGDFENWIKVMEYDCKSITTAIRNIHHA